MPTTRSKQTAAGKSPSAIGKANTPATPSHQQTIKKPASPSIKSETTPCPSPPPSPSTSQKSPSKSNPRRKAPSTLIHPPTTPLPTPALTSPHINYTYAILRGEQLVLTFEPYKSLILPYWAFRTVRIARASCAALLSIFDSYVARGDFVGADMARKFVQMGMTRARRYANWKGGRKYVRSEREEVVGVGKGEREKRARWEGGSVEEREKRREKEVASEVFRVGWRRCVEDEGYKALKERWVVEEREWERGRKEGGVKVEKEEEEQGKSNVKNMKEEEMDEDDDEDGDEDSSSSD